MRTKPFLRTLPEYKPGTHKQGTIKLSSNENPLGVSPFAQRAIQEFSRQVHIYPDAGAVNLRRKIAKKYSLTEDQVIIGNGSDEIMQLAGIAYLNAGEEVIVGKYSFSVYSFVAQLCNGQIRRCSMTDGICTPDTLLSLLTDSTRIIFLGNPNNPTGGIVRRDAFEHLLNKLPENVLLVIDEAYAEFADDPLFLSAIHYIQEHKNLLVLRTFSKIYGIAGLRVGYGMANAETIATLMRIKLPFNSNILAQHAAAAALDDEHFVRETQRCVSAGRLHLKKALEALNLPCLQSEANFLSFQVPESGNSAVERIAEQGFTIRSLQSFGLEDWVRVSIGTREQVDMFISVLKALYA